MNNFKIIFLCCSLVQYILAQVVQIDYDTIPKYVTQIGGALPQAIQYAENYYIIEAAKTVVTILPDQMGLGTEMYAYSSIGQGGKKVDSPKIVVLKDQQVTITWVNNIEGAPILPVDTTISSTIPVDIYSSQVPMITHLHGLTSTSGNDGKPQGWYTKSGAHGPQYYSAPNYIRNAATFTYQNQNIPGLYYFHDHSLSVTRLNVISGLKGVYQITTLNETEQEAKIRQAFGQMQKVQLVINDCRFQQNGSIYYHDRARIPQYAFWIPSYQGSAMIVNGKSWPLFNVQNRKYRLKLMSTCNSRYLNVYFQDSQGKNITFYMIKRDAGYLSQPAEMQDALLNPFGRMEIIIDFSEAVGNVILKNNANIQYPFGPPVDPDLDGQIMMFNITFNSENIIDETLTKNYKIDFKYPSDQNPIIVPFTLYQNYTANGRLIKMLFNAENMHNGKMCQNRVYQRGQTYDLYLFNPTLDNHPIHIHLVTMQLIGRYQIIQAAFVNKFLEINNNILTEGLQTCAQFPKIWDYIEGDMILPTAQQKSKRDIIDTPAQMLTIIRISITDQNQKPLSSKYNGVYPMHCHMLQHEDNDLMGLFHVVDERRCFSQPSLTNNQALTLVRQVIPCTQEGGIQTWKIILIAVGGGALVSVVMFVVVKKLIIDRLKSKTTSQTSPVYLVQQKDQPQVEQNTKNQKVRNSIRRSRSNKADDTLNQFKD